MERRISRQIEERDKTKLKYMSVLLIIALILIVLALGLIIFNVPISQKAINIILLVVALFVVAATSGVNLKL